MAQDQSSSHSTAHQQQQQQINFRPERCADDYAPMRDRDDVAPETAITDVRRDDSALMRRDSADDSMGAASPPAAAYQTALPSPTPSFPAISSSSPTPFPRPTSKRSLACLEQDDVCSPAPKRRRRNTPAAPSPRPSRLSSRPPRFARCRSLSLPDPSALSRMIHGERETKSTKQDHSHATSVLLLLPSLSGDNTASSPSARRRTRDRPIPPPITRSSLRELETQEVLKNAQLIHDIIHDPSLQFRPNLEGPRGERKRVAAEQYWGALEREVDRLKICLRKDPNGRVKLSSNRFPVLFVELRDILCSLLPFSDRLVVEEVLEPEFLCQQLFRGVLDVVNLSQFIGRMMKEHCAPMRDSLVDKMMAQFEIAQESGQTDAFVTGLRMVFDLLEGMKLVFIMSIMANFRMLQIINYER
jgi:T-complex protein 11